VYKIFQIKMENKKSKKFRRKNRIAMADQLGENSLSIIRREGSKISEVIQDNTADGSIEYSMPTFLRLYTGYDFLENLIFAIPYIQRKYGFERKEFLTVLLYLYPKNIFSLWDFDNVRFVRFSLRKIELLERRGLVRCIYDTKVEGDRLFQLTIKGRRIVEEFYKVLSGEVEMDPEVFDRSVYGIDKRYKRSVEKLQQGEPSEKRKAFWTRKRIK